ncbi:MAG: hypothetical protein ABIX12_13195 [Rubrivivax sp.]
MLIVGAAMACAGGVAWAKLPPPTPEAKAKAAEAAAKAAWTGKVGAFELCQAQNKAAQRYFAESKTGGRETKPAVDTPACTAPGPFVYVAPDEARPIEAAGAHSPPQTATAPPSGKQSASELTPKK